MLVLAGGGRERVFCSLRSNDPGIEYISYIVDILNSASKNTADMYSTVVPSPAHC